MFGVNEPTLWEGWEEILEALPPAMGELEKFKLSADLISILISLSILVAVPLLSASALPGMKISN